MPLARPRTRKKHKRQHTQTKTRTQTQAHVLTQHTPPQENTHTYLQRQTTRSTREHVLVIPTRTYTTLTHTHALTYIVDRTESIAYLYYACHTSAYVSIRQHTRPHRDYACRDDQACMCVCLFVRACLPACCAHRHLCTCMFRWSAWHQTFNSAAGSKLGNVSVVN